MRQGVKMKMKSVEQLMEEYGLTRSQAEYALDGSRRDLMKPYKPQKRKDKSPLHLKYLDIKVEPDLTNDYGWKVTMKGKVRPIWVAKGTQYKNGSCKYYPAVTINYNNKQKTFSLSSLIWLGYLKKEIPAGYVVDHIDNDSFNNDVDNLQLLTIRQNIEKNPSRKLANKTYKDELEIQAKKYNITPEELKSLL